MKKYDRNINAITPKITKIQIWGLVILIISVVALLAVIEIWGESDIVCIVSLTIFFAINITITILMIRDVSKQKSAQIKRLAAIEHRQELVANYCRATNEFEYSASTKEQKLDYVIVLLNTATRLNSCEYFYANTKDFAAGEVGELLGSLHISQDLQDFVNKVLTKKLLTKSISRFVPEMGDIINCMAGVQAERDNKYFDPDVLYNYDKHIRYYAMQDNNGLWVVGRDEYQEWEYGWEIKIRHSKYATKELVMTECKRLQGNDNKWADIEDYNKTYKYDKEAENWNLIMAGYGRDKGVADTKYWVLVDYYTIVTTDGHQEYIEDVDMGATLPVLEELLPKELYDNIAEAMGASNSYDKEDCCKAADQYFWQHEHEIQNIINNKIRLC